MIIYGTKMCGKKNVVHGWGMCKHCGIYGKQEHYNARQWGHLYYIPLLPQGGHVRVIKECGKCKKGYHIPVDSVPQILQDLAGDVAMAVSALQAGNPSAQVEGETIPCIPIILDAINTFLCFNEEENARNILATLQNAGLTYAHQLAEAQWFEFHGQLPQAISLYTKAANSTTDNEVALRCLGEASMLAGDDENALATFSRVLAMTDDKVSVLLSMGDLYAKAKDYANAAKAYEECLRLNPDLQHDKGLAKLIKKLQKKAGKNASPYHTNGQSQ